MVTGAISIRRNWPLLKLSTAIRNWFGNGIGSAGNGSAMHNRTLRTKQLQDLQNTPGNSFSLHKTWITSTRVRVCQRKRWCKFTATFSSHAVRAAILVIQNAIGNHPKFHGVRNARRSCGLGSYGSANNCPGTRWNELKLISITAPATL